MGYIHDKQSSDNPLRKLTTKLAYLWNLDQSVLLRVDWVDYGSLTLPVPRPHQLSYYNLACIEAPTDHQQIAFARCDTMADVMNMAEIIIEVNKRREA